MPYVVPSSEAQAGFASRVGQRFDAAVVEVTIAIEHDLVEALAEANLGDERADLLRRVGLVAVVHGALQVGRQSRRRGDGDAGGVVHDLRVDVPRAAEHAEAWTRRG